MHILFLTDNFPPESNAPSIRTYEHTKEWVKEGHKVTVITCAPNFPDGKVYDGYKNSFLVKEKISSVNVWRVKTYISRNSGFFKRSIDFISFMISSFFFGLFVKKVDIILGTSPQFFTVISAWALSKIKRKPFVFELRDIWPASITAVGAVKKGFIINLLEKIEIFLYHQSTMIVSVTKSFKEDLVKRGIERDKIRVVLNGANINFFRDSKKDDFFIEKYDLHNKFVAGYIGTHGLAHALENILYAAKYLKNKKNIKFILAGSGAQKEKLEKIILREKLNNIVMIPKQPREMMPSLLNLCDVSIVHLKNDPLFSTVIPSKIFEALAMNIPIIASMPEGEATDIILSNKVGIVVPPENPERLSDAILEMYENKDLILSLSLNCNKALLKYDRKNQAMAMLGYLEEVVN